MGDAQLDFPGATATYADHINSAGVSVGSYVDADGIHHGYRRDADSNFITLEYPGTPSNLEYLYVNAINDAGVIVFRAKEIDDIDRSYVILPGSEPKELRAPGSLSTVGRDVNAGGKSSVTMTRPTGVDADSSPNRRLWAMCSKQSRFPALIF